MARVEISITCAHTCDRLPGVGLRINCEGANEKRTGGHQATLVIILCDQQCSHNKDDGSGCCQEGVAHNCKRQVSVCGKSVHLLHLQIVLLINRSKLPSLPLALCDVICASVNAGGLPMRRHAQVIKTGSSITLSTGR